MRRAIEWIGSAPRMIAALLLVSALAASGSAAAIGGMRCFLTAGCGCPTHQVSAEETLRQGCCCEEVSPSPVRGADAAAFHAASVEIALPPQVAVLPDAGEPALATYVVGSESRGPDPPAYLLHRSLRI